MVATVKATGGWRRWIDQKGHAGRNCFWWNERWRTWTGFSGLVSQEFCTFWWWSRFWGGSGRWHDGRNSVMDEEEKVVLDYPSDRIIVDKAFQISLFSKIAEAGNLYGCAQDIEGRKRWE